MTMQQNILIIRWIIRKFCKDILGLQMMNPTEFGDSDFFLLHHQQADSFGSESNILTTIRWIAVKFAADIHCPHSYYCSSDFI